jgi:hypothetical protein
LAFEMLVGKNPFDGLRENEKWSKIVNVSGCGLSGRRVTT